MEKLNFKINYEECITNVACSILKYFNCDYYHKTIKNLDEILEHKKPKNVVLMLCDGLGSKILDKNLNKDSFLIKHKIKDLTSVFPSTTAASTLSIQTGLNPSEHGWLGWSNYISPINSTILLFWDVEKGKSKNDKKNEDFLKIKKKFLSPKRLVDIIKKKDCDTYTISPYDGCKYSELNQMFEILEEKLNINNEKKKFMYIYYPQPDSIMHSEGCDSQNAKEKILEINDKVKKYFEEKLDNNTIIIIVADHGHLNVDYIHLKNYPDIKSLMKTNIYIEDRVPMFRIKEGKKDLFKELFEKYFGEYFFLLTKEEIKERKIFGDVGWKENELFNDSLGDFIAINKNNNNKAFFDEDDYAMVSVHGGNSDDEVYIPLIVLSKSN